MLLTIDDARETLRERENNYASTLVRVCDLSAEPGVLRARGDQYRLTDEGLTRLCRQVGAPVAYFAQLDPTIQASLLQHHLDRGDLKREKVVLITRGEELVGLEASDLHRVKSIEVLDAVVEGAGSSDLKVHRMQFVGHSFQLELVSEIGGAEVAPGDYIQGGVQVAHSLNGECATILQAFLLRLICQNGMTHRDCVGKGATRTRRLPADRPDAHQLQIAQIRRVAADLAQSLRMKLEAIKSLRNEQVEFGHLIQRWLERARLPVRALLPLIYTAWEKEGGRSTAYDAMNALTNVATHAENLDARVRRSLASLAGILAFRQIHFCPRCFALLGSPANSTPLE